LELKSNDTDVDVDVENVLTQAERLFASLFVKRPNIIVKNIHAFQFMPFDLNMAGEVEGGKM